MISLASVALRRGRHLLFEEASLQVHRGQRLGVVGRNGTGKSSLFALLRGELESDRGEVQVPRGTVIASVRQETPSSARSAMDTVLDGDPELRSILDEQAQLGAEGKTEALQPLLERLEEIDGFTATTRAGKLLYGLGFGPGDAERPVDSFSGGWRMRLNLAQALMCRSDVLLLDEPTNHLDLPAILWLERWLKRYDGIAMIISHDRDFLDGLCTHVAHIDQGRVTAYTGNYSQFENARAERLALQQALFSRQQKEIAHIQRYVERFRYKATKARQAQSRLKMLERMERIAPAHVDSEFHFQFRDPERQPAQLVTLDRARLGYEQDVLGGVRLQVQEGDRIGLLGVNGAGKSTLVKALADGSTLLAGERNVHKHTRLGYFAQHQLDQLNELESPRWHVARTDDTLTEQEARNFLGRFGFQGERVDEPVAPFSGGEKARLVLALLVLQRPNLLLLDEPTNHLDLDMRQALSMALMDYGGALVVIAHDRHLLRSVCEDLYIVHDGQLEHFDEDIDHYPAWLRAREKAAEGTGDHGADAAKPVAHGREQRKAQRRQDAERRARLRPLERKVQRIEQALAKDRAALDAVEADLADEALYGPEGDRKRLDELLSQQAELKEAVDSAEWAWLEASEALESATAEVNTATA
ncbi:MAG: ATP-binding cassette domain-containing protein [Pseudomonadota bacterium]